MNITIIFGLLAPPLKKQLKGLSLETEDISMWQRDADAIAHLCLRKLITPKQKAAAWQRLYKQILKAIQRPAQSKKPSQH